MSEGALAAGRMAVTASPTLRTGPFVEGSELMARSAAFEPAPVSRDHFVAARRANEPSASGKAIRRRSVREPQGPPQVPVAAGTTWVTGSASPGARPGADFSQVRVHTDPAARASVTEVGARPGTFGSPGPTTWLTVSPSPAGGRASHERQGPRPGGAPLGAAPAGARPSAVPARPIPEVLRGPGQPLAAPLREEMQARLGADFSQVRVHTDPIARASAAEVGARAYTSGSHVVIGDGGADKHTFAHELTHVIQQRLGPVAGTDHGDGLKVSDPSDRDEKAAEATAARVMRAPLDQRRVAVAGTGGQCTPAVHPGVGREQTQQPALNHTELAPDTGGHCQSGLVGYPSEAGATAGTRVQRAKLNIRPNDTSGGRAGTISGVSDWRDRPSSNVSGSQGQHLTAYVVFENAVENRVVDRTPAEAAAALVELVEEFKALPGMRQKNARYLDQPFEECEKALTEAGAAADTKAIGVQIDVILDLRNRVPGTAAGGKGGGHGEAHTSGRVQEVETVLRTGKPPTAWVWVSDNSVADDVRRDMWRLLSYERPPQWRRGKREQDQHHPADVLPICAVCLPARLELAYPEALLLGRLPPGPPRRRWHAAYQTLG